jgi:hypothetical protein
LAKIGSSSWPLYSFGIDRGKTTITESKTMKLLVTIVLTLALGTKVLSCECNFRDIKTELLLSKEIVVGKLIEVNKNALKIKVLKTWKGQIKKDSLIIMTSGGGCYRRTTFPTNVYFLIYFEDSGIHNCSRTTEYIKSRDVKLLDSLFSRTLWVNEKEKTTLSRLEYSRQFIVHTDKGEVDIKDKKVVYNFEGKLKSKESLPADLNNFYPVRYFLVGRRDSIDSPCEIDYIFYVNQVHKDMLLPENKRKEIERESLKLACP